MDATVSVIPAYEVVKRLTVLVIQPRVVRMLYGDIDITAEDVPYLQKLRASSRAVLGEF